MTAASSIRRYSLILGLVLIVLVAMACAKSEPKAAAPSPAAPTPSAPVAAPAPTPAPAPAPSATPTPAPTAASQPAPVAASGLQPLVPGGPVFDRVTIEKLPFWQVYQKYHQTKLPLWTRASYGGELRSATNWNPATTLQLLGVLSLNRPSYTGMLLLFDMGLCSMVGRDEDFSRCKGEYARNDQIAITPGMFNRWEQPDPVTYLFTLRKGILWPAVPPMNRTDREVTAEDVAWFLDITRKEGALKDNFNLVDKFEAVDRYTVRVKMTEPHAEILRHMANSSMGIFPKECYDEKGCLGGKHISPGPFLVKESVPRQRAVLEKNPEFHLKGLPYMDRVVLINIPDVQAQKASFVSRQMDVGSSYQAPAEAEAIAKQASGAKVQAQLILAGAIVLRPQLKGPLADVRVRRALTMGMDLPSVWGAVEGFQTFPNLVSRDYFGAGWYYTLAQAGEWYQHNPERAKKLLAEAGYPNGFQVSINTNSNSGGNYDMLLSIQANWKKFLGVDAKILVVDPVAYTNAFYEASWQDLYFQYSHNLNWWASGEAPLIHMAKGQRLNTQKIDDPVITDLYLKQRGELDPAKRTALLWQYEQYELTQVYVLRYAITAGLQIAQPWELNGASHQVAYFTGFNGPSWLGMIDTTQQPKR